MRTVLSVLFIVFCFTLSSQVVFSEQGFQELVLRNHPLAKLANLQPEMGESNLLKAKGGFDPKVYNQIDQKYFKGSQYYSMINSGLKLPTWYGIELKSGLENNRGTYLDLQNKTPNSGLWYGGVAVNLGQGMFIDQRRAELFKARIYQQSSLAEQKLQLNELFYESGYTYWNWFLAHHSSMILREALSLAQVRYDAIKRTAELGDRPGIDSVEARIQVQSRQVMLQQFEADLQNSKFKLATFLWGENEEPLELEEGTLPLQKDSIELQNPVLYRSLLTDSVLQAHPYLQIANFKVETLEVEKRLKREQLKPQLNLQYNFLNEPINYNPFDGISVNNYKWGLTFEMPLFLRKERGDLQLAELKLQSAEFQLDNTFAALNFKIKSSMVDLENVSAQIEVYRRTVEDTKTLLEAEKRMFENGESSLFLINVREMTYIQAQLKYIELITKNQQAAIALKFALARLF
jgi:outer membrane protein TolC